MDDNVINPTASDITYTSRVQLNFVDMGGYLTVSIIWDGRIIATGSGLDLGEAVMNAGALMCGIKTVPLHGNSSHGETLVRDFKQWLNHR